MICPDILNKRNEAAKALALRHYGIEDGLTTIRQLLNEDEGRDTDPVGLLEVNQNTVASGIIPIRFDAAPSKGVPFPSMIIESLRGSTSRLCRER